MCWFVVFYVELDCIVLMLVKCEVIMVYLCEVLLVDVVWVVYVFGGGKLCCLVIFIELC